MKLPFDFGSFDPSDLVSGHNGQTQLLTVKRTLTVINPRSRAQVVERICEDQWLNTYLVYSCVLTDGEAYECADFLKPSILKKYGGFTDALLDDFRGKAFHAFDQAEKDAAALRISATNLASRLCAS